MWCFVMGIMQTKLIVACSIYIRDVPLKGVRHEQIGETRNIKCHQ